MSVQLYVCQQLGKVVMGLCRYVRLLGCVATETGKLKTKGEVGVEEDLGPRGAEEGLAASAAQEVASTWDSNCSSWPRKLKLGEMMLRRCRTNSKASSRRTLFLFIRYARQMVADREMPAWQWTSTRPFESFTESAGQERGGVRVTASKSSYLSLRCNKAISQ